MSINDEKLEKLEKENQFLRKVLQSIRDYGKEGVHSIDGYPAEVVYDGSSYKRMVDSYREAAGEALSKDEDEIKEDIHDFRPAIDRLKALSEENSKFCNELENRTSENEKSGIDYDKKQHLIETYRYWYQCCLIAAWLLEHEIK